MDYSIFTFTQKPELDDAIKQLDKEAWPELLHHGNLYSWGALFDLFPDFQNLFCDEAGRLIAAGHTVPLTWDGSLPDLPATMEEIFVRGRQAQERKQPPNALCAVAAMVVTEHRGQGLSAAILRAMRATAARRGCTALIAPVRPTWKSRYPLAPIARYVEWKRADGAPFDPWIRVHWRLGAVPLRVAPNILTVEGSLPDWASWTGMTFPDSGPYVVEGALEPVVVDFERSLGRYEEPNYWMMHTIA
jgi:GNAT superfamily N-acetyltransferase